ncbi:hypothetical protein ACFQU3_24270 [Terrabacter sp. GCM10028922]|uniref:hypothetical protein n=1 Tax=Terrabacter sp. GCM10028922 TaxID=3273428 RepID=UPI00361643A5
MAHTRLATALSAVLMLAGVAVAAPASAASGPLAGTWTSIDTDGSNQTLDIMGSGGHVYSMIYVDDAATSACNGNPAMITGPGIVDGDVLVMNGTLTCLPGGNVFRSRLTVSFVHDSSTDTLTDDFGIVWQREG